MHTQTTKITKQLEQWHNEAHAMMLDNGKAALTLADKILDKAIEFESGEYLVLGTVLKATCLLLIGKNNKALSTLNEAKRLHRLHTPNNKNYLSKILFKQAILHGNQGNYQLSIDNYLGALKLADEKDILKIYSNIGGVYYRMESYPKAIEYYQKAKTLSEDEWENIMFLGPKINLAGCYIKINDIEQAKKIAFEALRLIKDHPDRQQIPVVRHAQMFFILGKIKKYEQKFDEALNMFQQALDTVWETSELSFCCTMHWYIAKVYFAKQEEDKALEQVNKALKYTDELGLEDTKICVLKDVVQFYKNTNQLAKAFPYYEMLYQLSQKRLNTSMNENLQKIISEREQEIQLLEGKNKEIEEQNAILKQFAYIISHDLREPIRGITGFASMLNNKYAQNLDKAGNEYLRFILSEAHSMNRNLARLLQYTTIEKNEDNIKEIDLQEIITQIQQQYQDESCSLNISFEGVSIKMQHQHAFLLFSELIDNAVQFRKENEDCRVEIKCESKEGHYHLSVKDYGIGIDAAYQHKFFKIFNKINKWEGTGAGVGLSICERIVQLYKGKISIESIPNQFSTFHIKIPA